MPDIDPSAQVSHSQDGRTLTGIGVSAESLQEVMDARAPVDDAEPSAPAVDKVTVSTEPTTQPKLTRGQARFSELTQARKDAEAKAEAAEKRAADLEARLNQQPPQRASVGVEERTINDPQAGARPAQPQPSQPTRPEPTEDEIGPGLKYETYGAFVKDQSKWEWEQQQESIAQRVRDGITSHNQHQQFLTHLEGTRAKGRAAYKDFDAMLQNGPGTYVNMPPAAIQHIINLPNSEHVQYAIMKDGALAQRLAGLAATNPYAFGLELATIAPAAPAALPASTGTSGSVTPPRPLQPVGSGSHTTTPSSAEHAKSGNYAAYKAAREAERGIRRRR